MRWMATNSLAILDPASLAPSTLFGKSPIVWCVFGTTTMIRKSFSWFYSSSLAKPSDFNRGCLQTRPKMSVISSHSWNIQTSFDMLISISTRERQYCLWRLALARCGITWHYTGKDWTGDRVSTSNPTPSSSPSERIPEAIIWNIMSQLASALLLCHEGKYTNWDDDQSHQGAWKAVIHRDIKPSNGKAVFFEFWNSLLNFKVLISDFGEFPSIKLGDFGLSVAMASYHAPSTYAGTPQYMPPVST
jgi:hypothetical protein